MRKHLSLLLAVSVLMNAFLAGFVISGCRDGDRPPFPHGPHGEGGPPHERGSMSDHILNNSAGLSKEGQKIVSDIVTKHKAVLDGDKVDGNRAIFDEISNALTAPKFDKDKIVALHKKLSDSEVKMKTAIGDTMTEIAESLSDKDRIAFFKDMLPPHPDDKGHDGPPPPDYQKP